MRVAARLAINALLPALLALAVIAAVLIMNEEIVTTQREIGSVSRIKDGILELNLLTTTYLLQPTQNNEEVWFNQYRSAAASLYDMRFNDASRQSLLRRVQQRYATVSTLFYRMVATHSNDTAAQSPTWLSPLEQRLLRELQVNNRFISSDITRLTEATHGKLADRLRSGTVLIILFTLLISALTAAMQWMVNRTIARAIGRLEHGTGVIASGNLDYKVGTDAKDEIGQLSRSFDHMARQLRTSMVSRDALVREIEERKRVELELKDLSERHSLILHSAGDGIYGLDRSGNHTLINPAAARILGYTVEELMGRHSHSTWHHTRPDGTPYPEQECNIYKTLRDGVSRHIDNEVFWKKDGSGIPVEYTTTPIYQDGEITGTVVTFRDITERKQAEQALRTSEANYRAIFDSANDAIFVHDVQTGAILDVNQRMLEMYKYSRAELEGLRVEDLSAGTAGYRQEDVIEVVKRAATGKPQVFEWVAKDKMGKQFWVEVGLKRVSLEGRDRLLAMVRDISERKRAEDIKAHLSAIVESAEDAIISENRDGIIRTWNKGAEKIYGYAAEEMIGKHISLLAPAERRSEAGDILAQIGRGERIEHFETVRKRKDGTIFYVSIAVSPIVNQEGMITGASIIAHDITDRVRVREALKLTQFSVDHASVSVFFVSPDARFLYVNEQASRTLGYTREELLSMGVYDIDPKRPRSSWNERWNQIKKERALHFETIHLKKDGSSVPMEMSLNYLSFAGREYNVAFGLDISERKRAENELTRSYNLTRTIIDSVNDSISLIDVRDFTIVAVNNAFLTKYGYSEQSEIAGKHCYQITHNRADVCSPPDDICPLIETVKTKDHFSADHVHYDRQGRKIYVEVSTSPIRDQAGNVVQVVHVQRDITERKRAEDALRISEARFRNLFKQSVLSMQILSPDGRTLEVNHAFEELWGMKLDALRGYNILTDRQLSARGIMPYIQKAFAGEASEIPVSFYDPSEIDHSGKSRWVKAFVYPVKAGAEAVHQVVLMHWDVTEMVEAQQALVASENRFRAFFESVAVGTVQIDAKTGKFLRTNQRFCDITGYGCDEIRSMTFHDLTHPDDRKVDLKRFRKLLDGVESVYETEKRYVRKDGGIVWVHVSASLVRDANGRPLHTVGVVQDVSQRKKMEDEIRHMAQHDVLTGLPNRRLFIDILNVELALTRRHGAKLGILFLDLDRFKEINDTLGHAVGDELLKQIAGRFRNTIRTSDTVARIGGDEFNIVLTNVIRTEDIADISRKIVESFREPVFLAGRELQITTSIGISIYPDDSEDVNSLLRYADIAMYHAKATGRNRYAFFNPAINVRSLDRMKFENYLRHTIARDELLIRYQPEIDIATGKIVCVEALVRWRHPELGMLRPEKFIPVAEETGYIVAIDDWVLQKSCEQLKLWTAAGLDSFCLTVNVSARQFQSPALVDTVSRILQDTGTDPRRLVLEVTEGTAMSDIERTRSTMQKLADMGVRISIDDFGTGCSSLNYLKRLPVERLKIDNSFIQDIATDADDRAIVLAISAMAHSMKMKVTAEGVETEEQLALVRNAGCEQMQGNLFSEPVSAEEFGRLVEAK